MPQKRTDLCFFKIVRGGQGCAFHRNRTDLLADGEGLGYAQGEIGEERIECGLSAIRIFDVSIFTLCEGEDRR